MTGVEFIHEPCMPKVVICAIEQKTKISSHDLRRKITEYNALRAEIDSLRHKIDNHAPRQNVDGS